MAKLYKITTVHEEPYFRKMRVETGYMYNFYNCEKDQYNAEWIFVPDGEERLKKLEHYEAATVRQLEDKISKLESALDKIANGTQPYNEREAFIFVDVAKQIASEALL